MPRPAPGSRTSLLPVVAVILFAVARVASLRSCSSVLWSSLYTLVPVTSVLVTLLAVALCAADWALRFPLGLGCAVLLQ